MKTIVGLVVFNEEDKIRDVLNKFTPDLKNFIHTLFVVDDGSMDETVKVIKEVIPLIKSYKVAFKRHKFNKGVGASIRDIIQYGLRQDFDICVIMAGNGKDDPREIPKLLKPILMGKADYVQGSRFLGGGSYKNLPFLRMLLIKGFTLIFSLLTGRFYSDTSNGFRAYRLSIFNNKSININQKWLDRYELETYLHFKAIQLGYRIVEVPVSKNYLPNVKNYSKIRPFFDWWKIMRPIFLLKLGLRT